MLADIVAKVVCAGSIVQGAVAATGEYGLMKLEKVTKMFAEKTAEHTTLLKGKDQAFAAMAHELRTPLNGIIGLTDSLLWSETNSMSKRAIGSLKIVRDTSRRLSQIIGNIMDNAAANAEKLILVLEDVKLFPVIEEVVTLVNPLLSRDTHIIVDVPEDLPAVRADSTRVMQILFNLIGNAAKFTEKGTITLTSTVNENFVCLRIKDTGACHFIHLLARYVHPCGISLLLA